MTLCGHRRRVKRRIRNMRFCVHMQQQKPEATLSKFKKKLALTSLILLLWRFQLNFWSAFILGSDLCIRTSYHNTHSPAWICWKLLQIWLL
ncbi:hypothetical protein CPB83DRAFT_180701 [Crepidotus variabilis]|uniref:Uncharacterized protein n=1 Tax=Crepidotus variabilis TaxID=179855 RepID=A0A9P6JS13_9AGAR|nr:hypothetical protein CPB83DRAFT_180701 [Crepidotus variabilis]